MNVDKSEEVFQLSGEEMKLLKLPAAASLWPFNRAAELLAAVEAARQRTSSRYPELADYPMGSARVAALTGLQAQEARLSTMVETLQPYLGSVAAGAETFLQSSD